MSPSPALDHVALQALALTSSPSFNRDRNADDNSMNTNANIGRNNTSNVCTKSQAQVLGKWFLKNVPQRCPFGGSAGPRECIS